MVDPAKASGCPAPPSGPGSRASENLPQPGDSVVDERANRTAIVSLVRLEDQADRNRFRLISLQQGDQGALGDLCLDLVGQGADDALATDSSIDRSTGAVGRESTFNPHRSDALAGWVPVAPEFLGPGLVQPDALMAHEVGRLLRSWIRSQIVRGGAGQAAHNPDPDGFQ